MRDALDDRLLEKDWLKKSSQDFVYKRIPQTTPLEKRGNWSKYLCAELPTSLPGVPNALFQFERNILSDEGKKQAMRNQLFFSFNDLKKSTKIGQFLYTEGGGPNEYNLAHRHVGAEFRGKGIGSALLRTSEEWFRSVARISGQSVTLFMIIGQPAVMKWALENGFKVDNGDEEILNSILHTPEKYELLPLAGDDVPGDEYIVEKDTSGKIVRLFFKKTLTPDGTI